MSDYFGAGGRVVTLYPTPKSMADKVNEYFNYCLREIPDPRTGEVKIKEYKTPTYSGLARYLGFSSRMQMLRYANDRDEAYDLVLADAKLRLEDYLEGKLVYSKAPAGIMFALKNNAGWEEKSTQQLTGGDGQPMVFGWATNAGDVIDAHATSSSEKEGGLPTPTPKIEGAIDVD